MHFQFQAAQASFKCCNSSCKLFTSASLSTAEAGFALILMFFTVEAKVKVL